MPNEGRLSGYTFVEEVRLYRYIVVALRDGCDVL